MQWITIVWHTFMIILFSSSPAKKHQSPAGGGWHSSFLLVKSTCSESRNEMAKCSYGTIEMKNVIMNDHRNEISL